MNREHSVNRSKMNLGGVLLPSAVQVKEEEVGAGPVPDHVAWRGLPAGVSRRGVGLRLGAGRNPAAGAVDGVDGTPQRSRRADDQRERASDDLFQLLDRVR